MNMCYENADESYVSDQYDDDDDDCGFSKQGGPEIQCYRHTE